MLHEVKDCGDRRCSGNGVGSRRRSLNRTTALKVPATRCRLYYDSQGGLALRPTSGLHRHPATANSDCRSIEAA